MNMIEPYATAIEACTERLSVIGYLKTSDSDYGARFSNGTYTIEVSTEQYAHPSISTCLIDDKRRKFELGLVQRILAPNQYAEFLAKANDINSRYGLDDGNTDKHTRNLGIAAHAAASIENLCEFLAAHKNEPFTQNEDFVRQYVEMEQERMSKVFGLDWPGFQV